MEKNPETQSARKPPDWLPRFEPRGNFKEDLFDVLKVGMVVGIFVQLPNLTLFTLISKLVTARGGVPEAGIEEGAALLQVIALTAPLTVAAMVFGMLLMYDLFKTDWQAIVVGALLLVGSMWLGNLLATWGPLEPHTLGMQNPLIPDDGIPVVPTEGSWNPAVRILQSLLGYFMAFGFWSFVHALVVGFFLAWAIAGKLYPNARLRRVAQSGSAEVRYNGGGEISGEPPEEN